MKLSAEYEEHGNIDSETDDNNLSKFDNISLDEKNTSQNDTSLSLKAKSNIHMILKSRML